MQSFRLIMGTFHIVGYKPDGDSMRFKAKNWSNWHGLGNVKRAGDNHVQLRFQGIDTLETHAGGSHQPYDKACEARDWLLDHLGITGRQPNPNTDKKYSAANDGTPGTILVRGLTYGRPICYVFKGNKFTSMNSGADYTPTVAQIKTSANYKLLLNGHAYPLFYKELDPGVRNEFTWAAIDAYNHNRGLWPYDWSEKFQANGLVQLENELCIFPKLFRRLAKYMKTGKSTKGFVNALKASTTGDNDKLELVSNPGVTIRLSDVLAQTDSSKIIKMTEYPENLIFD